MSPVMKPNFLILGAAKCGTTSLYQYLKGHPEVFLPDFKEPTFFVPYDKAIVKNEAEYFALFRDCGGAKAVGEASVGYIYYPESPELIRDHLGGGVRLILLVRNPVNMMYSAWAHRVRVGDDSRPAEEALLSSFDGPYGDRPAYFDLANFAPQLARYYACFPRQTIQVLIFEEFFSNGLPQFSDLCRFLGVSSDYHPEGVVHNKGMLKPRSRTIQRFVSDYYGRFVAPIATRIVPSEWRHTVKRRLERWNREGGVAVPPLEDTLRRELEKRLEPSVAALGDMLEKDLLQLWFQSKKRKVD